jgi:hypothetical protein
MRLTAFACLLLCLGLVACGGDEPTPATDSKAAAEAATQAAIAAAAEEGPAELPPLPTGDYRIVSVTLGKAVDAEGQVSEGADVFAPTDKIHAAVVAVGSSEGLTLSARWTAADGTEVAKAGQSLTPTTPTVATFSIAQPGPWPAGDYKVEIAINDRVVETRSFRVE